MSVAVRCELPFKERTDENAGKEAEESFCKLNMLFCKYHLHLQDEKLRNCA